MKKNVKGSLKLFICVLAFTHRICFIFFLTTDIRVLFNKDIVIKSTFFYRNEIIRQAFTTSFNPNSIGGGGGGGGGNGINGTDIHGIWQIELQSKFGVCVE